MRTSLSSRRWGLPESMSDRRGTVRNGTPASSHSDTTRCISAALAEGMAITSSLGAVSWAM